MKHKIKLTQTAESGFYVVKGIVNVCADDAKQHQIAYWDCKFWWIIGWDCSIPAEEVIVIRKIEV
jgi:hypothetical protein